MRNGEGARTDLYIELFIMGLLFFSFFSNWICTLFNTDTCFQFYVGTPFDCSKIQTPMHSDSVLIVSIVEIEWTACQPLAMRQATFGVEISSGQLGFFSCKSATTEPGSEKHQPGEMVNACLSWIPVTTGRRRAFRAVVEKISLLTDNHKANLPSNNPTGAHHALAHELSHRQTQLGFRSDIYLLPYLVFICQSPCTLIKFLFWG
ncbi:hypothetical protein VTO42DRAFT_4735 [Malbranchea cinnamomea]